MYIYEIVIRYNSNWGAVGYGCFLLLLGIIVCFVAQLHRYRKASFFQCLACIMLFIYAWTVLESTVFARSPQANPQYELRIFWSWKVIFRYHEWKLLKENILNCLLLMPCGCLLPIAMGKKIVWKRGLMIGVFFSMIIELLQLITRRGLFEFDDIIHNGIGCMMGAVLGSWCRLRMLKKFKMPREPHAS
ncbi:MULTISPECIES: VanZ family protein [Blautia]|uniref:VanZ family protein n=1 Tax=Blautia TaxID=572511 RepID=UPI001D11F508|nr:MULTISPECIES: VanZ family protein [Blautia]MCC2726215.1 VanZ family protein [Blautia sp. MSK22_86]